MLHWQCASTGTNPIDPTPMALTRAAAPTRETAIVAAHLVRLVTDYAVQQGVDVAPLLAEVGWSAATFADSEARLRYLDFAALCERLARSEEHTSELQSLMRISYAVFCLKKKTTKP